MIKYSFLIQIIKLLVVLHKEAVVQHRRLTYGTFMAIRMFYVWKSKLRQYGAAPGDISNKFQSDIKNSLTYLANIQNVGAVKNCYGPIQYLLTNTAKVFNMKMRFAITFKHLILIQKRVKDQIYLLKGKIEAMMIYWQRIMSLVHKQASELQDQETSDLFRRMLLIPKEV